MASKLLIQHATSTVARNQTRFFSVNSPLHRVENVLVIGSGLMGSGIAQSCATTGKFNSVTLQDVSQQQLNKAHKRIVSNLAALAEKKKVTLDKSPEEVAARITTTTEIKPVSDKNLLIIEAIPELLEPKQSLFKNISAQFKGNDSVILCTNTSSLACSEIGKHVEIKERFAGLHFFNPVPLMKLVEIVRTMETNTATFESLQQFVKDIDKVSVACKDTPGFIVNRLLVPYMQEAIRMLERGDATARDIDIAMKLGAGYPMGPFELLDYVGLDTNKFIVDAWSARGDPNLTIYKSKLLESMVAKGKLGKKSGKGFYDYSTGKKQ